MSPPEEVDGRQAKRVANRQAVIDALLELYREGRYDPSTTEIADRAAVSQRSLFRYFEDVRALNRALLEQLLERAAPYSDVGVAPTDPVDARAAGLASARVRYYEVIAPGARAARFRAPRHPAAAAQLAAGRNRLRDQLQDVFEPELRALARNQAPRVLAAAEVLASFESYDLLRSGRGMSAAEVIAVIEVGLLALFAPAARRP